MNNYNRIAWLYDQLASFVFRGNILKSQIHFLSHLKVNDRVLIIGGGRGQILKYIDQLKIPLTIDFIEPSELMIEKARKRKQNSPHLKVNFYQVGFELFESKGYYNSICCFFFLDLFNEHTLIQHIGHIKNVMNDSSCLLVSDFQIKQGKWWQKGLSIVMHGFFKLTTGLESNKLKDINHIIEMSGFTKMSQAHFFSKFIFSAMYKKVVSKNGNHS